jgi:SOS response regulatory protein OraA/RecX
MRITALRELPRDRVEIDLDERSWRVLPAAAVVRAGLVVGRTLDRETARELGRELRRTRALADAARLLRHRDLSRARLEERLERRGAGVGARAAALDTLERAGLVDDARMAASRAESRAGRGYGDAAIRAALEEERVAAEHVEAALAGLEPEPARARRLLGPAPDVRTLRRLAAKGFDLESLGEPAPFAD